MKWIKASERLPEKYGIYYVRVLNSGLSTPDTSCFIFDEGFIVNHIGDEVTEWLDESATPGESKELEQLAEKLFPYPVKKNIFAISHLEYEKVNNYICDLVDTYRKTFTEWLDESPESKEPLKELKQNCQDAIDYIKDMEDDFQQGCKTAYSVVVDWIEERSTENNKNKQS